MKAPNAMAILMHDAEQHRPSKFILGQDDQMVLGRELVDGILFWNQFHAVVFIGSISPVTIQSRNPRINVIVNGTPTKTKKLTKYYWFPTQGKCQTCGEFNC